MNRYIAIRCALLLGLALTGYSAVLSAGSGQVVLFGGPKAISLGDNFNFFRNPVIFSFTLPSTISVSGAASERTVLKLETNNVNMGFDEVYVNPVGSTCFAETPAGTDLNDPYSIGYLETRNEVVRIGVWNTSLMTFPSSLLRMGTNRVMICARAQTGLLTGPHDAQGSGGIDDFSVRNVVLHYKTNN